MTLAPTTDVYDTRNLTENGPVDGFTLTAYAVYDTDMTPHGQDCYDAADVAAWRAGEWHYAGVVVVASREGIELGSASIWSLDTGDYWADMLRANGSGHLVNPSTTDALADATDGDGQPVPGTFAHGYGRDLIADAVLEGREVLASLVTSAAGLIAPVS